MIFLENNKIEFYWFGLIFAKIVDNYKFRLEYAEILFVIPKTFLSLNSYFFVELLVQLSLSA